MVLLFCRHTLSLHSDIPVQGCLQYRSDGTLASFISLYKIFTVHNEFSVPKVSLFLCAFIIRFEGICSRLILLSSPHYLYMKSRGFFSAVYSFFIFEFILSSSTSYSQILLNGLSFIHSFQSYIVRF